MEPDSEAGLRATELDSLLLRVGQRFGRIEPRRRMQDYVRGLLGPVGRKNSWQLAEHAGHATPYGLQRLLSWCQWDAGEIRDDLQEYVADRLGRPDGVLIVDDTGFLKKGTVSAGVQRKVRRLLDLAHSRQPGYRGPGTGPRWSHWRRRHQAVARHCHYQRRTHLDRVGHEPPSP